MLSIRNGLLISLFLNSILIGWVIGYMELLFYISFLANVFLIYYIFFLIKQRSLMGDDLSSVYSEIDRFAENLESLYGLEAFYGDQDLKNVIIHSKQMLEQIYLYQEKHFSDSIEEVEEEAEEESPDPEQDINDEDQS